MGRDDDDDDHKDLNREPPDFPPRLQYLGDPIGLKKGEVAPASVRRIFGTHDFLKYDRPVPPPPPPPNSYHKKPLYWQMQGTGYASPINRIALWGLFGFSCFALFLVKFGRFPDRVDRFLGTEDDNSPEWYQEEKRHRKFYFQMFFGLKDEEFQFQKNDSDKVKNLVTEYREKTRWDIREVDRRVKGIPHMHQLRGKDFGDNPGINAGGTGAPQF